MQRIGLIGFAVLGVAFVGRVASAAPFREIVIFPEIHQDIGYTHTYDHTLEDMARCLEAVVPFLEANPEATFWWENVYTLRIALERRPHLFARAGELIRQGRFGVGATYSGIDATATPGESIVRTMSHAKWWMMETFGVEPKVATLIDMSGFPPQMAQILRKSGVDLLIYTRAYGPSQRPFECLALDGSGIPACFVREEYDYFGFTDDLGEPDLAALGKIVNEMNPEDWSGNVLWGFNCGGGDNDTPNMDRIQTYIDAWNATHPNGPALRFGLPSELPQVFSDVESGTPCAGEPWVLFGQTWPIIKREEPTFRALSQAERALFRAESLAVFVEALGLAGISPAETERIWNDFLWVYEHNWGGRHGGSDRAKFEAARQAAKDAKEIEERYLQKLAGAVRCASRAVVAYNPLNWSRSGVATVCLQRGDIIIGDDSLPVPAWYQPGAEGTMARFVARDVPPFGYRTYRITREMPPVSRSTAQRIKEDRVPRPPGFVAPWEIVWRDNDRILTAAYVTALGHILSMDTRTGAGRLSAQEATGVHFPVTTTVFSEDLGSLGWHFTLRGEVESSPYTTSLIHIAELDRWEIETEIDYVGVSHRRVFLPLPFDSRFSEARLGTPFGSWVSPAESHHADFDGFVSGEVFSPRTRHATGHIGGWRAEATPWRYYEKWFDVRDPETGEGVLISARENNQAFYRDERYMALGLIQTFITHDAWPRKTGIHRYRFALRCHPEPVSDLEAARFGWETAMPLVATVVPPQPEGMLPPAGSFLDVDGDVVVTALKLAHDGDGAVVRMYVPEPEQEVFELSAPRLLGIGSVVECDFLERGIRPLSTEGEAFRGKLGGYEIGAYRLDITGAREGEKPR